MQNAKIYVAGHRGMVGSAVVRKLKEIGCDNFVLRTSKELDLRNQQAVNDFFAQEQPEIVVLAAAKVGGILANSTRPAEFIYDNIAIQNNVIEASRAHSAKQFCFLGSSCIYPRECPQPIKEEYLLSGPLEETNEAYAIAKIAGLKMVEFFKRDYNFNGFSVMPCNLYGTGDNYHPQDSHVLPALIRRFCEAVRDGHKEVAIWGTGKPLREFMHVDDAAAGIVHLLQNPPEHTLINLGSSFEISIYDLAEMIAQETGFTGKIVWDSSKPDGTPRKLMDNSRLKAAGFIPEIPLDEGIARTVREYKKIM